MSKAPRLCAFPNCNLHTFFKFCAFHDHSVRYEKREAQRLKYMRPKRVRG